MTGALSWPEARAVSMKEIEVTLTLRNNRLKQRREELGMTQREFAQAVGIQVSSYCALETMKKAPTKKRVLRDGALWRTTVQKIADFHGLSPEELFPPAVLAVVTPKIVRRMDGMELAELMSGADRRGLPDQMQHAIEADLSREVAKQLGTLTPKEEDVIRMRFGLNADGSPHTLDDIGAKYGVQQERIRQIEAKALRKLRHPSRSRRLKVFAEDDAPVHPVAYRWDDQPDWWTRLLADTSGVLGDSVPVLRSCTVSRRSVLDPIRVVTRDKEDFRFMLRGGRLAALNRLVRERFGESAAVELVRPG